MRYASFFLIVLFCTQTISSFAQQSTASVIYANYTNPQPPIAYTFNDTDWYYIAFTKPINDQGAIYINGELAGDINWENQLYDHSILNIGSAFSETSNSWSDFFAGTIDEIKVSTKIRTQAEIKTYFNTNAAFQQDVATFQIWRFDEGTGTKFYDQNITITGNLSGNPLWVDGKFGKAIKYDGKDDRGRVSVDLPEYGVTYEMWVKFDGGIKDTRQVMVQPYGSSNIDFGVFADNTVIEPPKPSPILALGNATVAKDGTVSIPVTVQDFNDILTAQFTIVWDETVAEYIDVKDFGLDELNAGSFSNMQAGVLSMSWSKTDGSAVTVADNTVIFNLELKAIGSPGASSNIVFSSQPTLQEVSYVDATLLDVTYKSGKISIANMVTLAGSIKTENGEAIPGIEVALDGASSGISTTDENGQYSFTVSPGQQYTILPSMDVNADEGVTTLDVVMLQWHLLATKHLLSNKDLIACDVNNSKTMTATDISLIRAVILHKKSKFENRNAVEFINTDYTALPSIFDFSNVYAINPDADSSGMDFTAVKLGDANTNWNANKSNGRQEELQEINILLEKEQYADKSIRIPIKTREFKNMVGLQFTIEWNPNAYSYKQITEGTIGFYVNDEYAKNGQLTLMWASDNIDGLSLNDLEVLSSLEFNELTNTSPDETISITSALTPALAFNAEMQSMRISGMQSIEPQFDNKGIFIYPNPVQNVLHISGVDTVIKEYAILNLNGAVVMSGQMLTNSVDVGKLKKGVYVLQAIDTNNKVFNKKFVK